MDTNRLKFPTQYPPVFGSLTQTNVGQLIIKRKYLFFVCFYWIGPKLWSKIEKFLLSKYVPLSAKIYNSYHIIENLGELSTKNCASDAFHAVALDLRIFLNIVVFVQEIYLVTYFIPRMYFNFENSMQLLKQFGFPWPELNIWSGNFKGVQSCPRELPQEVVTNSKKLRVRIFHR